MSISLWGPALFWEYWITFRKRHGQRIQVWQHNIKLPKRANRKVYFVSTLQKSNWKLCDQVYGDWRCDQTVELTQIFLVFGKKITRIGYVRPLLPPEHILLPKISHLCGAGRWISFNICYFLPIFRIVIAKAPTYTMLDIFPEIFIAAISTTKIII